MRSHDFIRAAGTAALALAAAGAPAYPEFQKWSQANSGRGVNCAMCHAHPDGPDGLKAGQIGSLDRRGIEALGEARQAFAAGAKVHSPILNEFGNDIVRQLGRTEFIALQQNPGALAGKLDPKGDLDRDGIPDAREFAEGTDPLDAQSGDPWELFKKNFQSQRFHILMIAIATALTLWGLSNLLCGLHSIASRRQSASHAGKKT